MANKVKPTNVLVLHGWMMTELGLSGNDLLVYALIYGFTQTDEQWFRGSIEYITNWTNASVRTIKYVLRRLEEKELIETRINIGETNSYRVNLGKIENVMNNLGSAKIASHPSQNCTPPVQNLHEEVQKLHERDAEIAPNNNIYNNNYNNKDNNNINNEKSSEPIEEETTEHNMKLPTTIDPVEEVVNSYNTICKSFPSLQKLTDKRKSSVKRILSSYSLNDIRRAFEMAEESDFLSGRSKNWTGCGFDWIMNPNNIVKILEGNYKNKNSRAKPIEDSTEFWMKQVRGEINAPF